MLEKKEWANAYFITLTYRPEEQHMVDLVNTKTGEVEQQSSLYPRDMTLFLKNYRRAHNNYNFGKVRYFYCGEYGDLNGARHFHRIIFQENPIPDLKLHAISKDHNPLYTSETIEKIWGKGWVIIGEVTLESRGYVARYVMKKQTGEGAKYYKDLGIEPEFVRMSLKPGIGMKYFEKNYEKIYKNDEIIIQGNSMKPARIFDEKFWEIDPVLMQQTKDKRRDAAIATRNNKLSKTDLSSEEYSEVERLNKDERLKFLRRDTI